MNEEIVIINSYKRGGLRLSYRYAFDEVFVRAQGILKERVDSAIQQKKKIVRTLARLLRLLGQYVPAFSELRLLSTRTPFV